MTGTGNSVKPKERTKAKQRYLRRKKERRKNKPKTGAKSANADAESGDEDEHSGPEENVEDIHPAKDLPIENGDEVKEKRPKKRRKVVEEESKDVEMMVAEDVEHGDSVMESQQPARVLTPQAALPSFPLPALPHAPSKSVLAMQGLDQALVDAEIVDPETMLPIPDGEGDGGTMLSEKMRKRLKDLGITELFAVQTRLLPFLLPQDPFKRALYQPYDPPRDICVSAPTGSGKTLAYVLPIIEILSSRIITRLRALIVLPTRDLVTQVRETFEALGKGRGLQIGTATGQQSFSHEQSQLVADRSSNLKGGSSKVDVLICTPGRLMDHLHGTPNFSLQHLRFLVIDEADRLLAQSFQDWLIQVLAATRPPPKAASDQASYSPMAKSSLSFPDAVAPAFLHTLPYPVIPTFPTETRESSCQKLLFSATLTRDPGKIAALELRNAKYFVIQESKKEGVLDVVMEKFSMPSTLTEHMIVCESSQKPLMFFHLVHAHKVTNALVFTKSAESTTRLVRLFDFFEKARARHAMAGSVQQIVVHAYSSDLPAGERKTILEKFRAQEIQILVCSDLISRGIDISHVSHVVSYDVPVDMRKYVHRVGRTARAGRAGDAWTLVEEQEARYFKGILRDADHLEKVKRIRVGEKELSPLVPFYETALGQLKEAYTR
ncbi:ATP-dependent RNA helicase dbp6 [Hypsizygus marmoreus]|uniref:ATP-dependent RNA helicase n=1 Tax=Hypsizygus marmoreus TaxID=39966 RepID=A0A369K2Y4_HYPMA|nr:ATP-dependent RNA helicase dbp6 [Hypsizygus marmoreus]